MGILDIYQYREFDHPNGSWKAIRNVSTNIAHQTQMQSQGRKQKLNIGLGT